MKQPIVEISIIFILLASIFFVTPLYVYHYQTGTVAFAVKENQNVSFINNSNGIQDYGSQRPTSKTRKS